MKKIILIVIIALFSLAGFSQEPPKGVPERAKLISQSCTQTELFMTLIDLDNKEIVILRYCFKHEFKLSPDYELAQVIRTGIKTEPLSQEFIKGNDALIKPDGDENVGRDEKK